jgi:hypothetical protein
VRLATIDELIREELGDDEYSMFEERRVTKHLALLLEFLKKMGDRLQFAYGDPESLEDDDDARFIAIPV